MIHGSSNGIFHGGARNLRRRILEQRLKINRITSPYHPRPMTISKLPMKEDDGKMHRNSLVITCKAFTPDKTVKAIQIWTREKGRKSSV